MPSPGQVLRFRPPLGPGIRIDTAIEEGMTIPPYYDSMIAKLLVWDTDRPAALARVARALTELELNGVPTTRDVALEVIQGGPFASGDYSTGTLIAMMAS